MEQKEKRINEANDKIRKLQAGQKWTLKKKKGAGRKKCVEEEKKWKNE